MLIQVLVALVPIVLAGVLGAASAELAEDDVHHGQDGPTIGEVERRNQRETGRGVRTSDVTESADVRNLPNARDAAVHKRHDRAARVVLTRTRPRRVASLVSWADNVGER